MIKNNAKNSRAYEKIREARNILLVSHERPDTDAVSSVCALAEFLEKNNKKYSAFISGHQKENFYFLPHSEKIKSNKNEIDFSSHDLIVVLDCGGIARTGLAEELKKRFPGQFVIELDHHPKNDDYADLEIRDTGKSSTTELVYDFFKKNKIKIDKRMAAYILAGIMTDSGGFIYPSTTDRTVAIAGEMMKAGANLQKTAEQAWGNKTLSGLKKWGEAISNIQLNEKYNIAYIVFSREDMRSISREDLEGIAGFLSNLRDVSAVLVLSEEDGIIKGSLRTAKAEISVAELAKILGGGGHPKAAGFKVSGRLERTGGGWRVV